MKFGPDHPNQRSNSAQVDLSEDDLHALARQTKSAMDGLEADQHGEADKAARERELKRKLRAATKGGAAAKRIAADAMVMCVSTRPNRAPPNKAFKKRARTLLRTSRRAREGVSARSTTTIANGISGDAKALFSRKAEIL